MDKRLSVNEHVGFSPKRLNELSTTQPHYWLLLKCKLKYSITSGESIPHTNSSTGTSVQDEAEEITPQLARRRGALTLGKASINAAASVLIDVVSTFIDSLIILQQAIEWVKDAKVKRRPPWAASSQTGGTSSSGLMSFPEMHADENVFLIDENGTVVALRLRYRLRTIKCRFRF
ncbi:hypothetical protein EVAR_56738_1 [Eumeta japonica]|uniref:Uncharacterized protein n=1 Tax=Eumeta variegata TaxID=151549 RepID=A0A4C1ZQ39_EUMVA|nr:hypothetical protein EVAR_56738_1 [Eumeta japonica]